MAHEDFSMSDNAALNATRDALDRHELPHWVLDHLRRYREDPASAQWWDGREFGGHERTPTLLLTTRGRRSGRLSTMPLIYGTDAGRHILVGSKGGAPTHPAWYLNLADDPVVGLRVAEDVFLARASTAAGEERERLMELMVGVYPPYTAYQELTDRRLPVVVLERLPDTDGQTLDA